jgi:hypothetical protein
MPAAQRHMMHLACTLRAINAPGKRKHGAKTTGVVRHERCSHGGSPEGSRAARCDVAPAAAQSVQRQRSTPRRETKAKAAPPAGEGAAAACACCPPRSAPPALATARPSPRHFGIPTAATSPFLFLAPTHARPLARPAPFPVTAPSSQLVSPELAPHPGLSPYSGTVESLLGAAAARDLSVSTSHASAARTSPSAATTHAALRSLLLRLATSSLHHTRCSPTQRDVALFSGLRPRPGAATRVLSQARRAHFARSRRRRPAAARDLLAPVLPTSRQWPRRSHPRRAVPARRRRC